MRDTHRLKEKYELSLDNRQIVSLTVASLVVLGGVFMLGVVVGKKLSGELPDKPPADQLSALDQKTAALDSLNHDDASLTFPDELTRKSPTINPPATPAAPKAEVARAPEPKKEPESAKPPAPPAEPKAEPVVAAAVPSPVAEPEPAKVADAPKPELAKKDEPKSEPTKLPESPKAEPVATRTTRDAGALAQAFARVQRPPAEAAADGAFTLQLSAYQDRAEADRFAAGLRDKGYAPYIVEATVPNKGVWYRVRMGRFPSKDAASRYLEDFKRETSMNAIVTSN
jgi:cell division septation protein DedD